MVVKSPLHSARSVVSRDFIGFGVSEFSHRLMRRLPGSLFLVPFCGVLKDNFRLYLGRVVIRFRLLLRGGKNHHRPR